MNLRSNKIKPKPVPQNSDACPSTSAIKGKLDPVFLDFIGSVKEKKVGKYDSMRMSD